MAPPTGSAISMDQSPIWKAVSGSLNSLWLGIPSKGKVQVCVFRFVDEKRIPEGRE
jgi:hypothetical protein